MHNSQIIPRYSRLNNGRKGVLPCTKMLDGSTADLMLMAQSPRRRDTVQIRDTSSRLPILAARAPSSNKLATCTLFTRLVLRSMYRSGGVTGSDARTYSRSRARDLLLLGFRQGYETTQLAEDLTQFATAGSYVQHCCVVIIRSASSSGIASRPPPRGVPSSS